MEGWNRKKEEKLGVDMLTVYYTHVGKCQDETHQFNLSIHRPTIFLKVSLKEIPWFI